MSSWFPIESTTVPPGNAGRTLRAAGSADADHSNSILAPRRLARCHPGPCSQAGPPLDSARFSVATVCAIMGLLILRRKLVVRAGSVLPPEPRPPSICCWRGDDELALAERSAQCASRRFVPHFRARLSATTVIPNVAQPIHYPSIRFGAYGKARSQLLPGSRERALLFPARLRRSTAPFATCKAHSHCETPPWCEQAPRWSFEWL